MLVAGFLHDGLPMKKGDGPWAARTGSFVNSEGADLFYRSYRAANGDPAAGPHFSSGKWPS